MPLNKPASGYVPFVGKNIYQIVFKDNTYQVSIRKLLKVLDGLTYLENGKSEITPWLSLEGNTQYVADGNYFTDSLEVAEFLERKLPLSPPVN